MTTARRRVAHTVLTAGLAATLLLTATGCSSGSSKSSATTTSTAPAATGTAAARDAALATKAYVWGSPLVVSARTFDKLGHLIGVNHLYNQQQLSGLTTRVIVAPNQDTLYSIATVDLRHGPVVLTVPDVTDRYWTYQLLDSWTTAFAYVGTRGTDGKGGTFVITPPGWTGTVPPGAHRISSPTDQMFLLGRFLVSGPDDIPNVVAITGKATLKPLDPAAPRPRRHRRPPGHRSRSPMRASGSSTSSPTRWRSTRPPPLPSVRSSPSSRPSGSGRGATRASRSPTRRSGRPSPRRSRPGSAPSSSTGSGPGTP